jgi:hypothetical protein
MCDVVAGVELKRAAINSSGWGFGGNHFIAGSNGL